MISMPRLPICRRRVLRYWISSRVSLPRGVPFFSIPKGRTGCCWSWWRGINLCQARHLAWHRLPSQGYIPMLLRRVGVPLIFQHVQCRDELETGRARFNYLINVAASGGDVGIVELLCVFRDQLFAPLFGVSSPVNLVLEEDIDCAIRAHHSDLCCGPGIVDVTTHMFAIHHIVCATIGLTSNHSDLWHSRLTVGIEQLGSVTDDAVMLLAHAG